MKNYLKPYKNHLLNTFFDDFLNDSIFKSHNFSGAGNYNIIKIDDSKYKININAAGYKKEDIEITQNEDTITIKGYIKQEHNEGEYLHQGFSSSFHNSFAISRDAKVISADLKEGILDIIIEEDKKQVNSKRINIR